MRCRDRVVSGVLIAIALALACAPAHGKGQKMPGDEFPAVMAFRAYAAKTLGVSVAKIQGGPISPVHAELFKEQRVGKLWAFVMWGPGSPKVEVRGWASPDGVVITLEQNLGLLFAEAGAWGDGPVPPLDGKAMATRLVWSLRDRTLETNHALGLPYPELVMNDGAGSLRFATGWRAPGPGGAGGGPVTRTLVEITLGKDRSAVAVQRPIAP